MIIAETPDGPVVTPEDDDEPVELTDEQLAEAAAENDEMLRELGIED